jgi:cytochrome oxidase Cu insertion factor (SCO1/SenC/PrrC family)
MTRSALIRALLIFMAGLVLAVALGLVVRALWLDPRGGGGRDASVTGTALVGGPFELTDQNGQRVKDTQFRGKLMAVFFGYIFCPDICPTTLLDVGQALDKLGKDGEQVQPIFITIDPERDTPAAMKDFLANFHPRVIGLTGTTAEIQAAAKAYRVFYAKAGGKERDYLMDHSVFIYLMDREGRYLTHFTNKMRSDEIAAAIRKFL